MNTDYKDIKKGIKRAEYDRYKYYGNIVWSIIISAIIGFITKSALLSIIVFIIGGVISARKYFEK